MFSSKKRAEVWKAVLAGRMMIEWNQSSGVVVGAPTVGLQRDCGGRLFARLDDGYVKLSRDGKSTQVSAFGDGIALRSFPIVGLPANLWICDLCLCKGGSWIAPRGNLVQLGWAYLAGLDAHHPKAYLFGLGLDDGVLHLGSELGDSADVKRGRRGRRELVGTFGRMHGVASVGWVGQTPTIEATQFLDLPPNEDLQQIESSGGGEYLWVATRNLDRNCVVVRRWYPDRDVVCEMATFGWMHPLTYYFLVHGRGKDETLLLHKWDQRLSYKLGQDGSWVQFSEQTQRLFEKWREQCQWSLGSVAVASQEGLWKLDRDWLYHNEMREAKVHFSSDTLRMTCLSLLVAAAVDGSGPTKKLLESLPSLDDETREIFEKKYATCHAKHDFERALHVQEEPRHIGNPHRVRGTKPSNCALF